MKNIKYKDLINRCKDLQNISIEDKNAHNQKLYATIYQMLTGGNIFKQLSCETCLNVLVDLQYTWEESQKIYKQLIAVK